MTLYGLSNYRRHEWRNRVSHGSGEFDTQSGMCLIRHGVETDMEDLTKDLMDGPYDGHSGIRSLNRRSSGS